MLVYILGVAVETKPERKYPPTIILLSFDGFRADYLDIYKNEAPTITRFAAGGVRAEYMTPVFPSNTFPVKSLFRLIVSRITTQL